MFCRWQSDIEVFFFFFFFSFAHRPLRKIQAFSQLAEEMYSEGKEGCFTIYVILFFF